MAIYSMSMSVCTTGGGAKSAVEYEQREAKYKKLLEQKQEELRSKIMLEGREITAKEYAQWVADFEKSLPKNQTRVLDKHMLALPREFDAGQKMEVCERYLGELQRLSNRRLSNFSIAIHDNQHNPHAHISFVARDQEGKQIRPLTAHQIDQRTVDRFELAPELKNQSSADLCRKAWADVVNDYAREKGIGVTVDHRSLKAQGIERLPTVHVGPEYRSPRTDYQERLKTHNEEIKNEGATVQRLEELTDIAQRAVRVAGEQNDWLRSSVERANGNATTVHELHTGIDGIRARLAECVGLAKRAIEQVGEVIEKLKQRYESHAQALKDIRAELPHKEPARRVEEPTSRGARPLTPAEFEALVQKSLESPKSSTRPLDMKTNAAGMSFKDYMRRVKSGEIQEKTQPAWLQSAIKDGKDGKIEPLQSLVENAKRNPESKISQQILAAVKEAFPEQAAKAKTRTRGDDFTR